MADGSRLARLQRAPTYRLVYDAIEQEILSGRLAVGDPLPTETALAEQLAVNRSTVREGIRLLEQGGLVTRDGGKRPRIAIPHYKDLASSASRALVLHAVTFRELWEASMLIEPAIAERAASGILPDEITALEGNVAEMDALLGRRAVDLEAFVAADRAFHDTLASATHNRVLVLAHEPVTTLFIPAGRVILPKLKTYRRVLDAHRRILDFVKAHDAAKARDWMSKHMRDFERGFALTGADFDRPLDALR